MDIQRKEKLSGPNLNPQQNNTFTITNTFKSKYF